MNIDSTVKNYLMEWSKNSLLLKIELKELERGDFESIINSKLGYSQMHKKISYYLYNKTQGNLLKLNYLIDDLYEKKYLYVNKNGNWEIKVEDYKEKIIDLGIDDMFEKQLKVLTKEAFEFLKSFIKKYDKKAFVVVNETKYLENGYFQK